MTAFLTKELAEIVREKYCSHPVTIPGSEMTVRCGSRLVNVCPSCAETYRGDVSAIMRSGVWAEGLDVSQYRFYLVTLTGPSFGTTHYVAGDLASVRRCQCGVTHSPENGGLKGVPVDSATYDYDAAVRFNYAAPKLLNASLTRLRRSLSDKGDYSKVWEWQKRLVLHAHLVLRFPSTELIDEASIRSALAGGKVTHLGMSHKWGAQIDVRQIQPRGNGAPGVARSLWYLSKALGYLGKDVSHLAPIGETGPSLAHAAKMAAAAARMPCKHCQSFRLFGFGCPGKAHARMGSATHPVTFSRAVSDKVSGEQIRRGWSFSGLTRGAQKEARKQWARENADHYNARFQPPKALLQAAALAVRREPDSHWLSLDDEPSLEASAVRSRASAGNHGQVGTSSLEEQTKFDPERVDNVSGREILKRHDSVGGG